MTARCSGPDLTGRKILHNAWSLATTSIILRSTGPRRPNPTRANSARALTSALAARLDVRSADRTRPLAPPAIHPRQTPARDHHRVPQCFARQTAQRQHRGVSGGRREWQDGRKTICLAFLRGRAHMTVPSSASKRHAIHRSQATRECSCTVDPTRRRISMRPQSALQSSSAPLTHLINWPSNGCARKLIGGCMGRSRKWSPSVSCASGRICAAQVILALDQGAVKGQKRGRLHDHGQLAQTFG
jgi:hypothetical protein